MKNLLRLLPLAGVTLAASLFSACQSTSLTSTAAALSAVPTVLQANPDLLGGLIGREAVGTLAVQAHLAAARTLANAPVLASVQ